MDKRRRQHERLFVHQRHFNEQTDSYVPEYERWKKPWIVKSLIGVYELPPENFIDGTVEENLKIVGHGDKEPLSYNGDEGEVKFNPTMTCAGSTSALRTPEGIRPIIFIRQNVVRPVEIPDPKEAAEFDVKAKLFFLLHEMGHAEDIEKQINYDHDALTIDNAKAEAYAHRFLYRHANRLKYRWMIDQFVRAMDGDRKRDGY